MIHSVHKSHMEVIQLSFDSIVLQMHSVKMKVHKHSTLVSCTTFKVYLNIFFICKCELPRASLAQQFALKVFVGRDVVGREARGRKTSSLISSMQHFSRDQACSLSLNPDNFSFPWKELTAA